MSTHLIFQELQITHIDNSTSFRKINTQHLTKKSVIRNNTCNLALNKIGPDELLVFSKICYKYNQKHLIGESLIPTSL